jgi:hypothetical protein
MCNQRIAGWHLNPNDPICLRLFVELLLQNAWAILLKLPFGCQVMASPVDRLRMKS